MTHWLLSTMTWIMIGSPLTTSSQAQDASALRLVPFPKDVRLTEGSFALDRPLTIELPAEPASLLGRLIGDELERLQLPRPQVRSRDDLQNALRWSAATDGPPPQSAFRPDATSEDYALQITPAAVTADAPEAAGLFYAVQTLCQLIRANSKDGRLPCLTIRDWPSIRWRAFQDDITRGPSSTLETLQREVSLGAALKMNIFTYYMEYQYAFKKHPEIGPKNGSLTPAELQALVAHAKPYHVDILGNQQSFGHFARILKHERYQHLRETRGTLCPVKEETYQLLDDLYSEVVPLLPFPFFNVCCDETYGLGTGPSKELADKIGVGGVYVRHIRRIYDLLKDKYGKRMMMWGDIILNHPEHLKEIPKDTIMLTWGYLAKDSFEDQIIPFAQSGYEFFVCPGVACWNRILPDFGQALVNIRNFVRDGAKHGAIGVLNTAWDDDGGNFNAPNWHGYAWGAECAWNASSTNPEDFNLRVGAVLFGESGDHFGQAIELLTRAQHIPTIKYCRNERFWSIELAPPREVHRDEAQQILDVVRPAIEHLKACRQEATTNADLLDYFLFGAQRIELIGRRMLARHQAVDAYKTARKSPLSEAGEHLLKAERIIGELRDDHAALAKRFEQLWMRENRPFALDWTMRRFRELAQAYTHIAEKIATTRKNTEAGKPLPTLIEVGLVRTEGEK